MRLRLASIAAAVLVASSWACTDAPTMRTVPPQAPVTITNDTDRAIEITYETRASSGSEASTTFTVAAHGRVTFGIADPDQYGCAAGTLTARAGGQTISRLDRPCSGWIWQAGLAFDPAPS